MLLPRLLGCFAALSLIASASSENQAVRYFIDVVTIDEFPVLIRQNQRFLLLLTKGDSHYTKGIERELGRIKEDVQMNLQVHIAKMEDKAEIAKEFGLPKLPGVLFFRKGKAIIYDGAILEDEIYEWVQNNLQSSLQNLNDQNFEHLTQAATGATTGDWFVLFCNSSTIFCRSLQPAWETVASQLKNRLNVALVDLETSPELLERFKIERSPTIKFLHHGKMYDYSVEKFDISSLTTFALGWYKNVKHDSVPAQKTPFDSLVEKIVLTLKRELQDPYVVPSMVMLLLPLSIVIAAVIAFRRDYKVKLE